MLLISAVLFWMFEQFPNLWWTVPHLSTTWIRAIESLQI